MIIRLAEPNTQTTHLNTVACIRGAGMVVEYRPFERLSITARPFHALLLCGLARNPKAITQEDEALERFLRSAEPPEHDKWLSTVRLKEQYKPGYKKALDELFDQVRAKLREAVAERIKVGTAGPELLAKKFPIGPSEGGTKPKQPFHFRSLKGELTEEGAWRFSGEARADEAVPDGWEVTVDLRFGGEGRGRDTGGLIRHFVIDQEKAPNASCRMEDGRAVVQLPPQVARFSFVGESDPARHPVDAQLSVSELVLESRRVQGKR
ncbi:MAG: hypothetical protein M3Y59_10095 [Myxococcota bacterium]|nr:hypothetical protein [Myxococcota bacterium]